MTIPTPYILPAGYAVLTGNHNPPIVDAAGVAFWPLNVKYKGGPLYFAVFLQETTGEAREVLSFPGAGQGAIFLCEGSLWASAFHSSDDAVSPPFVAQVPGYSAPPPPLTLGNVAGWFIARLGDADAPITNAVEAVIRRVAQAAWAAVK